MVTWRRCKVHVSRPLVCEIGKGIAAQPGRTYLQNANCCRQCANDDAVVPQLHG
jgi:hypothetical protein